jgi:CRISPR-associated protein Cmr5
MSALQTRAQKDLIFAERCVAEVPREGAEVKRIYGGLCHGFPVLVRTCGLAQAVAFHLAKSAGETKRAKAHHLLLRHVAELVSSNATPEGLVDAIRNADTLEYMRQTRQVLDAFIYFKRFAVSVLKVESSRDAEDDGGQD